MNDRETFDRLCKKIERGQSTLLTEDEFEALHEFVTLKRFTTKTIIAKINCVSYGAVHQRFKAGRVPRCWIKLAIHENWLG